MTLTANAVAIGWRPELAGDLLAQTGTVGFVEVVAENCLADSRIAREVQAVAQALPVALHGVKLSLGSAEGIDDGRAIRLGRLARQLDAPFVSEHVAFVRAGGHEIGHLTALPRTRAAVATVARNVARARRHLPDIPLLLENVVWTVPWSGDQTREEDFYFEVAEATGCALLLDVANLYANAINEGEEPSQRLARFPLDRVAMLHVAGGLREDGIYVDTHAHPIPSAVFALVEQVTRAVGPRPAVIERDDNFPPFDELCAELATLARCLATPREGPQVPVRCASTRPGSGWLEGSQTDLAIDQERLAALLTAVPPPGGGDVSVRHVDRTRRLLVRKRVDAALPLLPRLRRADHNIVHLAIDALRSRPRAGRLASVDDALTVAHAAAAEPAFAAEAQLDLLNLRARFRPLGGGRGWAPRWTPFFGRARLPGGDCAWAFKGAGFGRPVRLWLPPHALHRLATQNTAAPLERMTR